jgi:hypothetical protein
MRGAKPKAPPAAEPELEFDDEYEDYEGDYEAYDDQVRCAVYVLLHCVFVWWAGAVACWALTGVLRCGVDVCVTAGLDIHVPCL